MQDAFSQDMFNLGGLNSSRCNGHIQVSAAGKVPKRDRKGCKKAKIEAIMKNNLASSKARIRLSSPIKKVKPVNVANNSINSNAFLKTDFGDKDDPYTFTEAEPQILSLYPSGNNLTLSRKIVPLMGNKSNSVVPNRNNVNMVCLENGNTDAGKVSRILAETLKSSVDHTDLVSKVNVVKTNRVTTGVENSSRTMNKLQADIARNKVIGKRRKVISSREFDGEMKSESNINSSVISSSFTKVSIPAKRLHSTWQREKKSRHEALQRIQETQQEAWDFKHDLYPLGLELSDSESEADKEEEEESRGMFQRHWFMGCVWGSGDSGGGRESRLAQVKGELRRHVHQVWSGVEKQPEPTPQLVHAIITAARRQPSATAALLHPRLKLTTKQSRAKVSMLAPQKCCLEKICQNMALPCTRHCAEHIMYNVDQLLFEHCTAKFAGNTQCCAPVFDITHEMPLCREHARKWDNLEKMHSEAKPKKSSRKKPKPSALTRSTKRGKKKKKTRSNSSLNGTVIEPKSIEKTEISVHNTNISATISTEANTATSTTPGTITTTVGDVRNCNLDVDTIMMQESIVQDSSDVHNSEVFLTDPAISQVEIQVQLEDAVEEVSEEVLAIASLDPVELANQASRLLEEHDITNMLNQIPPDAFNDLFTEDKNGQYEPTKEETEELERALEAVDKDVRSLERMTRSLPLTLPLQLPLDTMNLLDDVPGVYTPYQNGFTTGPQPIQAQPDLRHS